MATGTPVTYTVDTLLNIIKRRDEFRIVSKTADTKVNIAYLAGEDMTSDKVIRFTDYSGSLRANWGVEDLAYEEFQTKTKMIRYYHFLVTDTYSETTPSEPIFWKHRIQKVYNELMPSWANSDMHPTDPDLKVLDIKILDRNMQEYSNPAIIYDLDEMAVYSNLENTYDYQTGTWNFYFVRYALRFKNSGGDYVNQVFTDILSQEPLFSLAIYPEDYSGMDLDPTKKVYSIQEDYGFFTITLPQDPSLVADLTYAIKPLRKNRLQLIAPNGKTTDIPWFMLVTNGRVLNLDNSVFYIYDVPEYLAQQSFSPYPPYKYIQEELAVRVTPFIYKLSKSPVVLPGITSGIGEDADMHLYLYVYDNTDNLRKLFTTEGALIGLKNEESFTDPFTGELLRWRFIQGVDLSTGFVQFSEEIPSDWKVYATFYYVEENFELTSVDYNPTTNTSVLGKTYAFYVFPQASGFGPAGRSGAIHFLEIDKNGIIQYVSQDGSDSNPSCQAWLGIDYETWKNTYTLCATPLTNLSRILLLGEMTVEPMNRPLELETRDIRVEGGGVKQSVITAVLGD